MKVRKGQWVSVAEECFARLKKNGIKGVNNKFRVSKGTNKENGFVELETSPHKVFVSAADVAYIW